MCECACRARTPPLSRCLPDHTSHSAHSSKVRTPMPALCLPHSSHSPLHTSNSHPRQSGRS
eukprot:2367208-Prymnesium_polylepis.1